MKKAKRLGKTENLTGQIAKDEDIKIFKIFLNRLKKKYNISSTDILNLAQEEIMIPSSIFNKKLSPLETIVKYLKENLESDYNKIAGLLKRDRKTVWQAHKNAVKKQPDKFIPRETEYNIPVSAFKHELSILESTVVYLKDQFNPSFHRIGELLQRDERTIWTVYNRAMKKIRLS
jgi:hypothetical protein